MSWKTYHPERPGRQETFLVYGMDRTEELVRYLLQVNWKHRTAHHADYSHQGDGDQKLYGEDVNRWHEKMWGASGYHVIFNPNGLAQVGYFGQNLKRGIHCRNNNTSNLGILWVGDFEVQMPTTKQMIAMERFVLACNDANNAPIAKTHKSFNATTCPGKNFPYDLWRGA